MALDLKTENVVIDARRMTGRDWRDIGRALERPVTQSMMQDPPLEVVYAMLWITLRRTQPGLTYDEVLDLPIENLPRLTGGAAPKALRPVEAEAATS